MSEQVGSEPGGGGASVLSRVPKDKDPRMLCLAGDWKLITGTYFTGKCFSHLNVPMNHLGILLNCKPMDYTLTCKYRGSEH